MMAANPNAIVGPDWIRDHLHDREVVFVHVDDGREGYEAGHLPSAVFADGYGEFTSERDGVRALVPLREEMEERLGRMGIDETKHVVFLSPNKSPWPSRAYWVMRYFRFPSVSIADRSAQALAREGLDLTQGQPEVTPLVCHLDEPDESIISLWPDVLAAAEGEGKARILDCRSDVEFAGGATHHPAARHGRIPRAHHLNWELLVDADGRFLPADQLRSLFIAAGIDGSQPVYPYCGGGIRAAASWLAMYEILGWEQSRNYDGSWAEWAVRTDLPIESDA